MNLWMPDPRALAIAQQVTEQARRALITRQRQAGDEYVSEPPPPPVKRIRAKPEPKGPSPLQLQLAERLMGRTLSAVAREAGVSVTTVERVRNAKQIAADVSLGRIACALDRMDAPKPAVKVKPVVPKPKLNALQENLMRRLSPMVKAYEARQYKGRNDAWLHMVRAYHAVLEANK